MKKTGISLFVFFAALLFGCTETEELARPDAGKEYFPLEVGSFRVYDVMDRRFASNDTVETNFQLRERVDTAFTDLAGHTAYRIVRSRRASAANAWSDDSVIVVSIANNQLFRQENNLKLVKLVFPVREQKSWSPNAYNSIDFDTLENGSPAPKPNRAYYSAVGQPFTVNGQQYPKTLKVVVNAEETFINIDNREEVYGENIGLLYLNYKVINYCTQQPCAPNGKDDYEFIDTGYERIEKLESYGKTN